MGNKLYKFENGKRVKALDDIQCPVCKSSFSPRTSKDKYCSRSCYYEMKRIRGDKVKLSKQGRENIRKSKLGSNNPMYGKVSQFKGKKRPEISGENHPNYKGGWIEKGYRYISVEGVQKPEHRYFVEKNVGRTLTDDEVVHHKNGNKLDNRLENLEVMTRAEHMIHHYEEIQAAQR